MAKNNEEDGWLDVDVDGDGEDFGTGQYVTKSELREMLEEIMGGKNAREDSDDDDGWELLDDLEDFGEAITSADVERIAEERVRAAIQELVGKKEARTPKKTTRTTTGSTAKPEPKKEAEPKPEPATRPSFRSKLWGGE